MLFYLVCVYGDILTLLHEEKMFLSLIFILTNLSVAGFVSY